MRRNTAAIVPILVVGCLATVGCDPGEPAEDVSEVAGAQVPTIHTWYRGNSADRAVYAYGVFDGAPRVRLTWKAWGGCNQAEYAMQPVPSDDLDWSICASLGLQYAVLSGNVGVCVSSRGSSSPTPVFVHKWTDVFAREVNYRVIDEGIEGGLLADSGWHPSSGNGCPRS